VVTLTTRWTELLKAIAVFRIPRIFIMVLGMTYRYIFLLIRIAEDMFLAKKSKMIVREGTTTGEEQRWVASRIGWLLKKSFNLSDDVYSAMRSRGYTGKALSYDGQRLQPADYATLGAVTAACAAFLLYGLLL
jgi:cobalt/nickel transport system permease protein